MIQSFTFEQDTKKNLTFVVPLIYIEKNDDKIGLGLQELNFTDMDGNYLFYQPLLLSMPSIREKINIDTKKYSISSLTLKCSNISLSGLRLSDKYFFLNNAKLNIFYKSQSAQSLEACLKVYEGKITRIIHDEKTITLSVEDFSQEKLHKDVPINKVPDNDDIEKEFRLKPIPMVYGDVEKSPLLKYVKTQDITPDDDLTDYSTIDEKTITKMNFVPDNIDPFLSNNLFNINGFIDSSMNDEYYDIDDPYYKTPLYVYNGDDYGNVLNVATTTEGEINESNNVFLDNKILQIVKYTDEDGDPINTIAGIKEDDEIKPSALLVNKKLELKNPFASNVEIDNQNHSTNYESLKIHGKLKKILKAQPEGGSIRRSSDSSLLRFPKDYYPWELGYDMNTMFNPDYITNLDGYIGLENNSIKRFILGFDVLESKFDFDEGYIVNVFRGYLKQNNGNSFGLRFVKLGNGIELVDYGDRPVVHEIDSWIFTQSGNYINRSALDIDTFAMVVHPSGTFGENIQLWAKINLIELYHHGIIQDASLLAKTDFYADVSGRTHENIYQLKMNFTLSELDYNDKDWTEHLELGIEFDEDYNQTPIYKEYGPDDNFNNIIRIMFQVGSVIYMIYPEYLRFYRPKDGEHGYGDINIEIKGTIYDMDNNIYLDEFPEIGTYYLYLHILELDNPDYQYFFVENSNYEILKGPFVDLKPLYKTSHIITDILKNECNYINEIELEQINDVDENHPNWQYAFTQHEEINSKKLLEDLSLSSKSIARFRGYDGKFIWNTIKDEYTDDDVNIIIDDKDVLNYRFNRTKLEDVKTKVKVKYYYDYGQEKLLKETPFIVVDELTYEQGGYDYSYYGLDENDEDSTLEFESKYIRDKYTAIQLRNYLLSWHMNLHNEISVDLPLKHVNIEVGDIVAFEKEINNLKLYAEPYTRDYKDLGQGFLEDANLTYRNGQEIYPYFMVIETQKKIDKISIKMVQLHKNDKNYFLPPVEEEEEELIIPPTGDVNFDGSLDVLDIVGIVSFIMDVVVPTQDQFNEADVNGDGNLDVLDVVTIVSAILDE
jgi:hypothetical protein